MCTAFLEYESTNGLLTFCKKKKKKKRSKKKKKKKKNRWKKKILQKIRVWEKLLHDLCRKCFRILLLKILLLK